MGFQVVSCPSLCNDRCLGGFHLSTSPSSCVSLRWLLEEFHAFLARAVHTWKYGVLFPSCFVSGSHCVGDWVLLAEYRKLDFSGDVAILMGATLGSTVVACSASVRDASGRNSHISTLTWTRILRWCFFVLAQNGEVCSIDASGALKSGILCTSCTWLVGCMMKGRE